MVITETSFPRGGVVQKKPKEALVSFKLERRTIFYQQKINLTKFHDKFNKNCQTNFFL